MSIRRVVYITAVLISMEGFAKESGSKVSSEVEVNSADKKVPVCITNRLEENLKKIDLKMSSIKLIDYEDQCESKNFCFTVKLLNKANVATFNVPKDSEVRYCEREGIRGITAKDQLLTTSNSNLSCRSGVYFWGNPSELCFCEVERPYTLQFQNVKQSKKSELPAKANLYFKDGKVTHFVSASDLVVGDTKITAGSPYAVKADASELVSLTSLANPEIPQCRNNRDPDEDHLHDVLAKYNIRRTDIAELSYSSSCDGDIPREDEFDYSAIRGTLTEKLSTKEILAPKNSYVSFCSGYLSSISYNDKEIKFWGHRCKGEVEVNWDVGNPEDKELYGCTLIAPESLDGHKLPAGVKIFFNKDRIVCFGTDQQQHEAATIQGVSIRSGTFVFKNGKVVQDNLCRE